MTADAGGGTGGRAAPKVTAASLRDEQIKAKLGRAAQVSPAVDEGDAATESPEQQETLDRTLEAHRAIMAHKLGRLRIAGVGATLLLSLALWKVANLPDWAPNVAVFGAYLPVCVGIYLAGLRWPRFARSAGNAVALGDVPVVWMLQAMAMPLAPSPGGIAGFTLGIFVLLVVLAALSLSTSQVVLVAALSTVFEVALQHQAHIAPGAWVAAALVLGLAALASAQLVQRVRGLVTRVNDEVARRDRLGRYFSPAVADLLTVRGDAKRPAEARLVTLMAVDIPDFAALSTKLEPEQAVELLNGYHARMVREIFRHGGTLDRFTGDGLFAYFGAPFADPRHAVHAIDCALGMMAELRVLNEERAARGQAPIHMGVGIHSGHALLGEIGSPEHRLEYSVVGDAVKATTRVEGLTTELKTAIVVSEMTRDGAANAYSFLELTPAEARGKAHPMRVFTPLVNGSPYSLGG